RNGARRGAGAQRRPSSLTRCVSLAVAEESACAFARFACALVTPCRLERLGPELRRHQVLNLELLLGGEREKLVRRLLRLQSAFSTLALVDESLQGLRIVADIFGDAALHRHRVAECGHLVV